MHVCAQGGGGRLWCCGPGGRPGLTGVRGEAPAVLGRGAQRVRVKRGIARGFGGGAQEAAGAAAAALRTQPPEIGRAHV